MANHNGKMPEADVVYSDVKFTKSKENATGKASSPSDSTYSELKISKTKELPAGSKQQAVSNGGSKVTPERMAIAVLSVLLVAAVIALGFTSYNNIQAMERVQKLTAINKNLTERHREEKTYNYSLISCPQPPTEPCLKCEEGWKKHEKQCYYFSTDASIWTDARSECQNRKGDLVKIDSKGEQSFLQLELTRKMNDDEDKFWIGLTDSQIEGTWVWVDGSQLNLSLSFWSHKEPDNWEGEDEEGEDCVRMGERAGSAEQKQWFDKSCKIPHRSICEKPAENGHLQCV